MSKLKWPVHIVPIGIEIISLPLKHQVTLVKMFGLMGIAARTMLLSLWPV